MSSFAFTIRDSASSGTKQIRYLQYEHQRSFMSRAAALDARKGEQKAALAAKAAEHAADLAMGLTATMTKIIKQDELICTVCGATKLGPITKCECAGGRSKPGEPYSWFVTRWETPTAGKWVAELEREFLVMDSGRLMASVTWRWG